MDIITTVVFIFALVSQVPRAEALGRMGHQCAYLSSTAGQQQSTRRNSPGLKDQQPALHVKVDEVSQEQVVSCGKDTNFCYALWREDGLGNQTIISQGCWAMSGKVECERSDCVADRPPSRATRGNTKFCCCSGDMCNTKLTDSYVADAAAMPIDPTDEQPYAEPAATKALNELNESKIMWLVSLGVCMAVFTLLVTAFCIRRAHRKALSSHNAGDPHKIEGVSESPMFKGCSPENLKIIEIVGQGRYGSVWRGTLKDQDVAIKIFPGHYRNYFCNERDIYTLPFMDHPSLLTYFGCDERVNPEVGPELLLVLQYAPLGCLQDFLRHTTPDWQTFCKMSAAISAGLAHLHTDFKKGDLIKSCVSHRDLNSRNILVKSDLSCCICDLGLAMMISGSKYYCNGEEQRAETKSINDVGTLRYMAPEVLEGAVNLRDCESALKQIDVYALGLVVWELSSRCSDLYPPGVETPPYRLPFEAEIGLHPTFEQMQVLVSRHKARPLLPETWRDVATVRLLKETIEDCWDQDAEARLTALCVDERLRELPVAWDRARSTIHASGISPTVNQMSQISSSTSTNNNSNNNNNYNSHNQNNNATVHVGGSSHRPCTLDNRLHLTLHDAPGSEEGGSQFVRHGPVDKDALDSTVSEGTVETLVTLSPSEPLPDPSCKNAQLASTQPPALSALQPYQGRNPCLERNLMTLEPVSQLLPNGNTLVDLSAAICEEANAAESHALLAHDSLQHTTTPSNAIRPATPIPYVQNAVFETDPPGTGSTGTTGCPKQPNVPGNGRRNSSGQSRWSWRRLFSDSSSSGRRKQQPTNQLQNIQKRSSTGSALLLRDVSSSGTPSNATNAVTWEEETKYSNLSRSLLPPSAVAPSNIATSTSHPVTAPTAPSSSSTHTPATAVLFKAKTASRQGSPLLFTKEVSDGEDGTSSSAVIGIYQHKSGSPTGSQATRQRPSSLALGSPDWLRPMRPPSAHILTPKQSAPSGRFSLYDDRIMMSQQQLVSNSAAAAASQSIGEASETRATSVPDMNC